MYRSRKFSSLFIILLMIINVVVSPLRIFAESAENVNEAAVMSLVASVEDVEHSSEEHPFGTHNIDEDIEVTPPANDTPPTTNENEVGNNPITDSHQGSEEEQSSEEIVDSADTTESEDKEQDKNDDQDKEQDKQQRTEPMEIPGTLTSVILRKDGMELNDGAFLEYDGSLEATFRIEFADSVDIQAGDTYTLAFPSALSFQSVSEVNVRDALGNVVGEAVIPSDKSGIMVKFNDFFRQAQVDKQIELKLVFGWNHSNSNEGETHYLDFGGIGFNLEKESQLMFSPASRDAVTNITVIKESTKEPLNDTVPLGAWGYLKVTVDFAVPNDGGYKAGDTTVVKLPDEMIFAGLTPSVVLEHQGTVIGHLTFSEADRTATITYAPGVEEKSDIKGSFFFSMRVDHRNNVHPHPIPQRFNVDFGATNRIIDLGNLNYTGKPLSPPTQFSKNGYFIDAGRTLHYDIVINQQNALMENVVLEDVTGIVGTMRDLRVLLGEYYVDSDNNRRLRNTVVLNVQPTYSIDSNGDRRFRLELGTIPEGKGIAITYKIGLDYQAEIGEPFENRATLTWNTVEEQTRREVEIYTTAGAVIEGSVFAIEMKKVDEAGQPLPGAKFEVIRDISGKRVGEIVTGSDGTGRISNLLRSNYTIREIEAPPGYELVNDEIKVKADEFSTPTKSVTKTVTNKLATTTFTVTKKWVNGEATNRPEVQFQLKRDGVNYGPIKTLAANSQDGATIEWTGLPKYKDNKTGPSVYTVEELPATNYVATISEVTATTATVTNTYTNEEKININVMKKWEDYNNKFQTRPSEILIKLKRNGQLLETLNATATNDWRVEFTDLHKYDSTGRAYEYTVEEDAVPGYKAPVIKGDVTTGFTIQNKYCNTEKVNIPGKKIWRDYNNKFNTRPTSITIHLLQNGTKIKRQEVQGNGNEWNFSFTDLQKYDSQGDAYTYTVEEEPVANYEAPVVTGDVATGFTVTNTYRNTETIDIFGKKTWDDANNQDNKRPSNITVQVMNGNQKVAEKTVSQADNWAYTFTGLPKYDAAGELIPYTVTEVPVAEYQAMVEGYNITNSYTPAKTQVSVTKVWEDADNQDGKRPAQISVQLLANGTAQGQPITLNASNNWMYTWNDLDLNQAGQPIVYTLQEVNVPAGYTSNIAETAAKQFTITNTYTPEKIGLTGKKTWEDANNQDGKRPDTITVNLLAEGKIVQTVTANQASNWTYNFIDLPKYKAGQLIEYTVQEVVPAGYSATYSGYSITNSYTPAKTQVSVTKVWEDANNQDGIRPNDIQVQLYANGTAQGQPITLNTGNNWMHTWNDLDLKQQGQDIVYTVKEVGEVTGYTTAITEPAAKQFTLTNSHTPEQTDLTVVKAWDDADNQDGIRPEKVTVALVADGKEVEQKDLTTANKWTHQWMNLPKYNNGVAIKYEVKEISKHDGYTTTVTHDATTRTTRITNSHTPEVTEVSGKKTWDDADNQDGKRPTTIEVALLADNKQVDTKVVTETDNWRYTFTNLPKYKAGKVITYTVKEINVPEDYTAIVEGTNITNRYTPETTSFTVVKRWEDGNDADKIRPQAIKVQLYVAGKAEGSPIELNAANNWSHTFTDLPKYASGKKLTYEVKEVDVPKGYNVTYKADSTTQTTITNSHTPTPKKEKDTLPKTGEDFPFGTTLIGALILAGVAGYIIYTKKRHK